MKYFPLALIYSRLAIGALLVALSYLGVAHFAALAVGLLTLGVLTDVFDGIVARQLNISTEKLRRLDSAVD
ncbi:CDP-alcohol phosphatidyltransferase family protein [Hymenobacter convexus]|uniref:CDP-alcohol phosphatidyltransferase family protein n=1 Tax=Hymenobacter sp. CA1UV-4 TaxID=3063782 RepID=UPI00271303BE|nr:CDP-alcohol phosphatidyltransferase family protein [Hymenobacter sp. CA1UV-4]MDO7851535.1 CDP-alcohol phosphatidyltransferase family protein [Hymenobacter sp. CA1UV-4]